MNLKRLVTIGVAFACCAMAQTTEMQMTCGQRNGRYWTQVLNVEAKIGFVIGAAEGFAELRTIGQTTKEETLKHFPNLTVGETIKALDRLYDTPENAAIPILMIMRVVVMRANGNTAADVEAATAGLRNWGPYCESRK